MLDRMQNTVLLSISAVFLPMAAHACVPDASPKWDKRLRYANDGSFYNQNKYSIGKGEIPARVGQSKIVQIVSDSSGCSTLESVVVADCAIRRSILIYGSGTPNAAELFAGQSEDLVQQHLKPTGTIDAYGANVSIETLLRQAKAAGLEVETDFAAYQANLKRKNRIDPFRMCSAFFPDISNNKEQGG